MPPPVYALLDVSTIDRVTALSTWMARVMRVWNSGRHHLPILHGALTRAFFTRLSGYILRRRE